MHFHTFTNFKTQKTLRQRSQCTYFVIYKHVTLFQLFYKISLHIFTSNHPKILPILQPLFPPPPPPLLLTLRPNYSIPRHLHFFPPLQKLSNIAIFTACKPFSRAFPINATHLFFRTKRPLSRALEFASGEHFSVLNRRCVVGIL